jgi:hypothetical protein
LAAELLEETLPRLRAFFANVLVRVDSDFDRRDVRESCGAAGVCFAFVAWEASNRLSWAEGLPESAWKPDAGPPGAAGAGWHYTLCRNCDHPTPSTCAHGAPEFS